LADLLIAAMLMRTAQVELRSSMIRTRKSGRSNGDL